MARGRSGHPGMSRGQSGHPGMARGQSGHPGMSRGYPIMARGQSGHTGMSRGQSGHPGMSRGQSGHPGMSRGHPMMARGHLALARGLPGIVRGGSGMIRGSAGMISRASGIVRRPVFPGRFLMPNVQTVSRGQPPRGFVMNRGLPMSRGEFGGEIGKGFVPGGGAGSSIRNVPIAVGLTDDNSSRIASKRKGDEVDVDLTIDPEVEDTKTDLTKNLSMEDVNMNIVVNNLISIKKSDDGKVRLLSKNTVNPNITVSIVTENMPQPKNQVETIPKENKPSENLNQIEVSDKVGMDFARNVQNIEEYDYEVKSQESSVDLDAVKTLLEVSGQEPYMANEEEVLFESNVDVKTEVIDFFILPQNVQNNENNNIPNELMKNNFIVLEDKEANSDKTTESKRVKKLLDKKESLEQVVDNKSPEVKNNFIAVF